MESASIEARSNARRLLGPAFVLVLLFVARAHAQSVTRVSVGSGGAEGNALSSDSLISHDGRFVVFSSDATNLVAGDTNGFRDVFVRDRTLGTTTLVSVSTGGTQGDGLSSPASPCPISADGRFIVFYSS